MKFQNIKRAMSLQEVGKELGITAERARQIEERALNKLRFRLNLIGLSLEDILPDQFEGSVQ